MIAHSLVAPGLHCRHQLISKTRLETATTTASSSATLRRQQQPAGHTNSLKIVLCKKKQKYKLTAASKDTAFSTRMADTIHAGAALQQEGAQQQPEGQQEGWQHPLVHHYLAAGRNWRAVEDFYIALVSGKTCLSQLGLAPAGGVACSTASATGQQQHHNTQQQQAQQQAQQQQRLLSEQHEQPQRQQPGQLEQQQDGGEGQTAAVHDTNEPFQIERTTYKLHVSYLGSSFSGWMRQPGKHTVEGALAAAIAQAGLSQRPPGFDTNSKRSKRAAVRAARRAQKKAREAADGAAAAAAADATATERPSNSSELQLSCKADIAAAAAGSADAAAVGSAAAAAAEEPAAVSCVLQLPDVACSGRTDAGVTAVGQVISFYSWQPVLAPEELLARINRHLPAALQPQAATTSQSQASSPQHSCDANGSSSNNGAAPPGLAGNSEAAAAAAADCVLPISSQLRVWGAEAVARDFHATFSATWRRYVYLLPLRQGISNSSTGDLLPRYTDELLQVRYTAASSMCTSEQLQYAQQAPDIDPARVDALLQQLQGRKLNYYAYARDTPKGKDCVCTLHVARASLVHLPAGLGLQHNAAAAEHPLLPADVGEQLEQQQQESHHQQQQQQQQVPCLCIELAGDRFLRRMVRVLVATAVRESLLQAANQAQPEQQLAGAAGSDALLELAMHADRQATAPPAPALGLCFAAVGYDAS